MTPETLFALSGPVALAGWLALVFAPLAPGWSDRLAALAIPGLLSVAYSALILAFWAGAPGGFGSLADVMRLFDTPGIALAGWLHYLASTSSSVPGSPAPRGPRASRTSSSCPSSCRPSCSAPPDSSPSSPSARSMPPAPCRKPDP